LAVFQTTTTNEIQKIMKTTKKQFDAVAYMRQQREKLSETLSNMTKSEIVDYFKKRNLETKVKPCA
jgi:fructose/tagatose bisphosphate aldolase